jgi:DNA polymerase (family 10)
MTVGNIDVARIFDEVADLLEISGESYFRVRAYRNASRVIRDMTTSLASIAEEPGAGLESLPGIGKDLANKITEVLETGDLGLKRELEGKLPTGLLDVMKVAGLGPRKAHALYLELGVNNLESLGEAAQAGKIRELKGFGPKTEDNILQGIATVESFGERMLHAEARVYAEQLVEHMRACPGLKAIEVAGSYRRLKETVGDLDVLVVCENAESAMERFVTFPGVTRILAKGPTKTSLVTGPSLQVDMRAVTEDSFGAALQYFTGSQSHSVALRQIAQRKGLKLNEYGVFRGEKRIAGRAEEDVYGALGLPWIPPELRENRGEIEAAIEGRLPELVELKDVRGDLHVHTDATDGRDTLADMVAAARRKGYLYIAITNHTKRVTMVGGLDEKGLMRHWREVERLDTETAGIHVLKGVEVDILDDGSLDIADGVLAKADYVVASVHYNTNMPQARMTKRIVSAIRNPHVNALGHPTGRIINKRAPYQVEMERVIASAADTGTFLELNAAPDRLDIDDNACRAARDAGVRVSIATDAHSVKGLDFMRYGVNQARRGWLEAGDVINTLTYRSLKKLL